MITEFNGNINHFTLSDQELIFLLPALKIENP
jgi:hypothetical protein